jgi:hypothetical protein
MIEKPALPVPPNLAGRNGGYDCTWQSPFGLKLLRSGHEETTGRMPFSSVEIINRSSSGIGPLIDLEQVCFDLLHDHE